MPLERFIKLLMMNDREIVNTCMGWEIDKEEITNLLIDHYREMGIFEIRPKEHAIMIRENLVFQLNNSKEIKRRREIAQREIARAREKIRGRG